MLVVGVVEGDDALSLELIVMVDELSFPAGVDVIEMVAAGGRVSSIELERETGFDGVDTETMLTMSALCTDWLSMSRELLWSTELLRSDCESSSSERLVCDGVADVWSFWGSAGGVLRNSANGLSFEDECVGGTGVGGGGAGPFSFFATCKNIKTRDDYDCIQCIIREHITYRVHSLLFDVRNGTDDSTFIDRNQVFSRR